MVLPKKPTKEELDIYSILVDRFISKLHNDVYTKVPEPLDKMIIYWVFDQGYSINEACKIIGIRRQVIWRRKMVIRTQLQGLW